MKNTVWKRIAQTAASILVLLAVWGIAYLSTGNELLVPSLPDCFAEMGRLWKTGAFWAGFGGSVWRAFLAFAISFAFALIFAIIAYLLPSFEGIFAPVVSAFRSLPVLALLLILLSLFSAAEAPVAVAFLSLFPMLYAGILAALRGMDEGLLEVSKEHGVPLFRRVTKVYLPLCAPYILRTSSAAISFSVKLVVSAEVLANTAKSLGGMMQSAKAYDQIPQLFALVLVAFLVGLILELALSLLAEWADRAVR